MALDDRTSAERGTHPRPGWWGLARHDDRGHTTRGTGILNNQLYVGRLVWNRLRYVKDPRTGRRISRPNPPEQWVVTEVPELRIVRDDLWDRVKARQNEIASSKTVKKVKASAFWSKRRAQHLLTGKVTCGICDGPLSRSAADTSPAAMPGNSRPV